MSTSTSIPSRTRSLRKTTDTSSSRHGNATSTTTRDAVDRAEVPSLERRPTNAPRSGQSPSRLPVKPPSRSTTTTTTTSTTRPPSASSNGSSNTSMRPPPPRATTSKPTTTAGGLERSTSTRTSYDVSRTTTTGGLQRSTSTRRTPDASQSGTSGGLRRSTSTRRPSDASNSTTSSDPIKQDRSRPPLTQYKHLRTGSVSSSNSATTSSSTNIPARGHVRNKSTSVLNGSNTSAQPRPLSRDSANPPKSQLQQDPPSLLQAKKASFSAYQQHFSPAKSLMPKPQLAAFLAPPSPSKLPSNIAISAETAKLQNELLQLHLMHKDAGLVREQWQTSAKQKLGKRFQDVVRKHERLLELESEEGGRINAVALQKWADSGVPGFGLDEKVRMLDEILTGVWNLGDSGGKHGRLVRRFEKWLARSQDILDAREVGDGLENDEVVFVEELDQTWKDECSYMRRKLETWDEQLRDLGVPAGKESTLKTVLQKCADLVEGMLDELHEMRRVEDEVMRRESDWIKGLNSGEMSDNDEGVMDGSGRRRVAGAIWRVM